ncbi:MAG: hypothetical protein ICV73_01555 [Acetobacteraceae bacterium]|nr:hypothetical protein [Acetobacteraceae bacterium]
MRLYPQLAAGYDQPETIVLDLLPGAVGPGPADAAMVVRNAVAKGRPYAAPDYLPPYRGAMHTPALPDAAGHLDTIPEGTPQFLAAHMYGCARLALGSWERWLGHPVVWWHVADLPRLELVPRLHWGNAHAGYGFLETGMRWSRHGEAVPLALSLDVVAHEVGHAVLYSVMGAPAPAERTAEYHAAGEAFADFSAALTALRFSSVVARLLAQTRGNLYALNLVSRLSEVSDIEQARTLDNTVHVNQLADLRLGLDGRFVDPLGLRRNEHNLAAPLTGAIWDCFVELYQDGLAGRGAIRPDSDARGWTRQEAIAAMQPLERASAEALGRFAPDFEAALRDARDLTGRALARVAQRVPPANLRFAAVAARFCEALAESGQSSNLPAFVENFLERGIDPRPLLGKDPSAPRRAPTSSPRWRTEAAAAHAPNGCAGCANPLAILAAHRIVRHPHREAAAGAGT